VADIVTYTAVFGGYDTLKPAKYPSVCFTDGKMGSVSGWEYQTIYGDKNPKWANRRCKILMHDHIDTEYSIYHDGNIQMIIRPEQVIDFLGQHDIAVFAHPLRDCIYEEAEACIREGKADEKVVRAQMARYKRDGFPTHAGLAACWVLIRRRTAAIKQFDILWWKEYESGAKRDQLSFNYICWKVGLKYAVIPGNLLKGTSDAFKRTPHKRAPKMLKTDYRTAYGQVLLVDEREC